MKKSASSMAYASLAEALDQGLLVWASDGTGVAIKARIGK
jgi:hypothetical protein